jgi:cyclohexa-1,5-dienecarbonyl-CoA hydratase
MLTQITRTFSRITLDIEPPTAQITLSAPPLNIIDLPMMDELLAAIEQIEQREDVSTVIISGNEKNFSVGVDIKAHLPNRMRETLTKFHSVIRALANTQKITIAAVQGNCMGGGAELALLCDLIYATDDSTWQFPEINLASYPPVAAVALSAVVGQKRAAELVLTGRVIHGEEAFAMGLVNEAVHASELHPLVQDVTARLASLSPAALKLAKKAFYAWDAIHFDKGLQRSETIYFDELIKTEDALEGINAFLEKRKPEWKGK